ncbi:hypothetical protein CTAYLR_000919 [Chrysophaeum taylorii]|uniref:Uncharacterized protein n=1 Tax=Chrysophaeum taylorii TaxID=2483200 RepID=A0AAD7UHI1_9STRA|nr:hypothetical protein CTAYLR_000919 [Chrysophaeum taylorii]
MQPDELPDVEPAYFALPPAPPEVVEAIRKQVMEREERARINETTRPEPTPQKRRQELKEEPKAKKEKTEEGEEERLAALEKKLADLKDLRRRVIDLIERRKTYWEKLAEKKAAEEAVVPPKEDDDVPAEEGNEAIDISTSSFA